MFSLADNPKCGSEPFCHIFEALAHGVRCGALGYFEGGFYGGALGALTGSAKGVVEAYEESGQIRVTFKPAGLEL